MNKSSVKQTKEKPNTLLRGIYKAVRYDKKLNKEEAFGLLIGIKKARTSELMNSADVLPEGIQLNIHTVFGVTLEYLASNGTKGDMFPKKTEVVLSEGDRLRHKKAFGDGAEETGLIYVPIAAQAGYSRNFEDPVFLNQLERLYIPGSLPYKGDRYRYFDVEGDSMEPTLMDGMQVIGEKVEQEDWKDISNFYIFVIVVVNRIMVKRLFKKNEETLIMISDNEEVHEQKLLKIENIKELWLVKRKVDWEMAPPKRFEIKI